MLLDVFSSNPKKPAGKKASKKEEEPPRAPRFAFSERAAPDLLVRGRPSPPLRRIFAALRNVSRRLLYAEVIGGQMATDYDSGILRQYADQLYRQAKWIVFRTAVTYGLAMFLVTFLLAAVIGSQKQVDTSMANSGARRIRLDLRARAIEAGALRACPR